MALLSVAVNGANPLYLGRELDRLAASGVTLFHVDVMDGVFCPQMTGSPALVGAIVGAGLQVDAHLMIEEPLGKIGAYIDAGAQRITFHVEACRHPHRVLQELAGSGVHRGIALNPGTPIAAVEPLLDQLESVLLLSVNPGWSGQTFSPSTAARLDAVRELIGPRAVQLAVDGAVTRDNLDTVAAMGLDIIVSGSAVFDGNPSENARWMLNVLRDPT